MTKEVRVKDKVKDKLTIYKREIKENQETLAFEMESIDELMNRMTNIKEDENKLSSPMQSIYDYMSSHNEFESLLRRLNVIIGRVHIKFGLVVKQINDIEDDLDEFRNG